MNKSSLLLHHILSKASDPIRLAWVAAAVLSLAVPGRAANFTTTVQEGSSGGGAGGNNWYTNAGAPFWQPGNTLPTAGNTYECIAGGNPTRLRNPVLGGSLQTFPGDSLQLNTNTEIRAKNSTSPTTLNFPGVGGNPGLIMNGGNMDTGDNFVFTLGGIMLVQNPSAFTCGDTGGNNSRGWKISALIQGNTNVTVFKNFPGGTNAVELTGANNTFTGTWIIKSGGFKATGVGSLGNSSVFLSPTNAAINATPFEAMYDVNSSGSLTITNGGTMILHQNCMFASVNINGTQLASRTYQYAELASTFSGVFAANGSGNITIQPPAPPPAPACLAAINGDTQVTLNWCPSANAGGYNIDRSGTSGGPYTQIASVAGTNFTDTGLVNGSTFYYVIFATNSLGTSVTNSPEAVGNPNPPVVNILAVGGTNQVTLTWDALAVPADSYTVKRSATANGVTTDVATGVIGTAYVDTTVANGTVYFYRIQAAITGGGVSGRSAQVSATTAPSTPGSVNALLFARDVIQVGWASPDPVAPQFTIWSSPDGLGTPSGGGSWTLLATTNAIGYTNGPGLTPATPYYYILQAQNAGGFSSYSPVVSANTAPAGGINVNFVNNTTNSSQNQTLAPAAPGYIPDTGIDYGDQGNGYFYGWRTAGLTNISIDTRWRQDPTSPDIRYDNFAQVQKGGASELAVWEIQIPNGFYWVHIVSGDPQNNDGTYQWNIEGTDTEAYVPATPPVTVASHWHDFTNTALVNDGRLTIQPGASAVNDKINFVDIYPATAVGLAITGNPQGQTNFENRPITLSAAVGPVRPLAGAYEGYLPVAYQWYQDTGSGFMPVANATNATYSVPLGQLGNAGDYFAIITNFAGSVTSQVATVGVLVDNDQPVLISIGSVDGVSVGVCFDELLDPVRGVSTALDDANYTVTDVDGSINIVPNSVTLRPDGKSVQLTLDPAGSGRGPLHGVFTVTCLADDLKGNIFAVQSGTGKVSGLTPMDVGITNGSPGSTYSCKDGEFEVVAGGADIWGNADDGHMTLQQRSGDWDVIVRVQSMTLATAADTVAKAGLMARQTFDSNSPALYISVNPPPPGRDQGEAGIRATFSGATAAWPTNAVSTNTTYTPAGMPNAWQRMTRAGNVFTAYHSTNGTDWIAFAQTNQTFTDPMLVGFATTAHTLGTGQSVAEYRNFHFVDAPTVSNPVGVTVDQGQSASFTVTATGPAEGGTLVYQWRKNTVIIPGANSATLSINPAQFSDAGSYDVKVSNSGGASFSAAALLVVRDTVPPVVTCPANIVSDCGGPTGTTVGFSASALDNKDGIVNVTCIPPSGSTFSLGTTPVNCSATDAAGNTGVCGFTVTVSADTTAPSITCSGNITTDCTSPDGAVVTFTTTATDACDPNPSVICTPASGSTFASGTTTVTCTATDASSNHSSCSFTVTVNDTAGAPTLTIVRTGATAVISWPATCTTYNLEMSTDLPHWGPSGATVTFVAGRYQATVSDSTGAAFYRLNKP